MTDLQVNVVEGVNQDGQGPLVIRPVIRDFMEKTAVSNVTIIVTRRLNVIDLQEIATEDVNQDGQGSHVLMPVKSRTMEQTVQINVEQTVSTLRVIM